MLYPLSYGRLSTDGVLARQQDCTRIADLTGRSESLPARGLSEYRERCDTGHAAWTDPICTGSGHRYRRPPEAPQAANLGDFGTSRDNDAAPSDEHVHLDRKIRQ